MQRRLGVYEILRNASQQPTREGKVNYLRQHHHQALADVLHLALDPRVVWQLPPGEPPYKPCEQLDQEGTLYAKHAKMGYYLQGLYPNITQAKRESLYIQLLESLHPEDAKLMIAVKDKRIPYEGIDASLVNEAFPGLVYIPPTE